MICRFSHFEAAPLHRQLCLSLPSQDCRQAALCQEDALHHYKSLQIVSQSTGLEGFNRIVWNKNHRVPSICTCFCLQTTVLCTLGLNRFSQHVLLRISKQALSRSFSWHVEFCASSIPVKILNCETSPGNSFRRWPSLYGLQHHEETVNTGTQRLRGRPSHTA